MVVESYGAWSPSAMAVLREISTRKMANSGDTHPKSDALHHLLSSLNITLMRSQARMLVLRSPAAVPDTVLLGYGKEE